MNIKYKSIEVQRFLDAAIMLIDKEYAKNFKEIAEKAGYSSQDFTDMKSGKKDLQRNFLHAISRVYPISESYILTGEGQMLKSERFQPETECTECRAKDEMIEMLKDRINDKDELIQSYKAQLGLNNREAKGQAS